MPKRPVEPSACVSGKASVQRRVAVALVRGKAAAVSAEADMADMQNMRLLRDQGRLRLTAARTSSRPRNNGVDAGNRFRSLKASASMSEEVG
ncbi:protein of unknown function [Methylocaldum szegediense]|uniref:Uncharacterized protein n=1 Tax=Methylocaldum szegediense TaxID=73780 RepID=A0ABM9I6Y5_9GAMM|nr:protein of unknown function [Methylocaldum szegediense]